MDARPDSLLNAFITGFLAALALILPRFAGTCAAFATPGGLAANLRSIAIIDGCLDPLRRSSKRALDSAAPVERRLARGELDMEDV